jgi:hypothetical protein
MALTLNLILDFPIVRGLVTKGKGEKTQTIQAFQYRVAGWNELDAVLVQISQKVPKGVSNLRLAVSDRRLVHGGIQKPERPKGEELADLLKNAVREVGLFSEDEDLVIGYQDSLSSSSGWECRFLGAPESVLEPLRLAGMKLGIDAIQVTSIETVLAGAVEAPPEVPIAILEVARSNARILLAKSGQVLASRLVRLSISDQGEGTIGSDFLLPLASEVYRSLEYFGELGHPEPKEIRVLGPLAHSLEEGETWEGVLGRKAEVGSNPDFLNRSKGGPDLDAYLTAYFLAITTSKLGGPWLIDSKRKSKFDLVCFSAAITGLVALGFGASLSIKALNGEGKSRRIAKAKMEKEIDILKVQADQLRNDRQSPKVVQERRRIIQKVREGSLPISRALATLAREKPRDLHLVSIQLKEKVLQLDGFIDSQDQLGAIRSFGRLDRLLSTFSQGASGGGELGEPDLKNKRTPFRYEVFLGKAKK